MSVFTSVNISCKSVNWLVKKKLKAVRESKFAQIYINKRFNILGNSQTFYKVHSSKYGISNFVFRDNLLSNQIQD